MKIHYLQHVPFEGPGSMEPWLLAQGHTITSTAFHANQAPPAADAFDWLIVMGGPMGVYDTQQYPWLETEKALIRAAIDQSRIVLGICLGAQLIADVCGAKVRRNPCREIGWHPVRRNPALSHHPAAALFPSETDAFHWHGDTFELPNRAWLLASSDACDNQCFLLGDRIMGLQFHLETTEASARALIEHCGDELDGTDYVQSAAEIMADPGRFRDINRLMERVLAYLDRLGRNAG